MGPHWKFRSVIISSFHWLSGAQPNCQSLTINIWHDFDNIGDVMIRARTGMMRVLRLILIKTDKNEKQKRKERGTEKWGSSIEKAWSSLAGTERWSSLNPLEFC